MLVVECDCGDEVPFHIEEPTTAPVSSRCDCGNVYELKVRKTWNS